VPTAVPARPQPDSQAAQARDSRSAFMRIA
jgi:hypothetical protein